MMKYILLISVLMFSLLTEAQTARPKGKLCFLGDTGKDSVMQKKIAQAMQQEGCVEIFVVGDLVYPDGIKSADDPLLESHFMRAYRPLMEKGIRFHLVMGNHDHRNSIDAWVEVAKKNDKLVFPNPYYAEKWGDICLFALDTMLLNGQGQQEWLNDQFASLKNGCHFSIAIGHHPYYTVGLHGDAVGPVKSFLEQYVLSKVDLYVSGHDHNISDEGDVKGTRLLVNGGGGSEIRLLGRAPRVFAKSAWGYITLQFSEANSVLTALYRFVEVQKESNVQVHESAMQVSIP